MQTADWIQLVVLILTFIGVLAVFYTLRADHEWRRRQYTLDIISQWNANTIEHINAIEERFPNIRNELTSEVTAFDALEIYKARGTDAKNTGLRSHMIKLLNYFEYIALAYVNGIADKEIVDRSLKHSMMVWFGKLDNFVDAVEETDGKNPWEPLVALMQIWGMSDKIKFRRHTA